jgi:hypothetical protein
VPAVAAGAASSTLTFTGDPFRSTLAPISPSAHSAPPALSTSTRQTTIAVGEPPTGARFWVSVQRA